MRDQHHYKSPVIEVYGHCRLLLLGPRVPGYFFAIWGGKIACMAPLDFSSHSSAFDLSVMASPGRTLPENPPIPHPPDKN